MKYYLDADKSTLIKMILFSDIPFQISLLA